MTTKRRRLSKHVAGMLKAGLMQNRRATTYKMIAKRNGGTVPCYCCGKHVTQAKATLEHVIPLSHGGTNDMDNLSISHRYCNQARGNAMPVEGGGDG